MKHFLLFLALFSSLYLAAGQIVQVNGTGGVDLLEYWSAARLIWSGANPYDASLVGALQNQTIGYVQDVILMWNPPWVFGLILPLAWLSFAAAMKVWFSLFVLSYVASIQILRSLFSDFPTGQNYFVKGIFWFSVMTFYPAALCLGMGQISFWMLFGLVLFYWFEKRGQSFWAGLALTLTTIKPHLFWLFYLFILFRSFKFSDWRLLFGLALGTLSFLMIGLAVRPTLLAEYFSAISAPPFYWFTPTLGVWLHRYIPEFGNTIRFLPSVVALGWFVFALIKRSSFLNERNWLYQIVPLSFLSSPFGWVFDFMVLLPASFIIFQTASKLNSTSRIVALGVILLGNIGLMVGGEIGQQYYFWYPLLIAVLGGLVLGRTKQSL